MTDQWFAIEVTVAPEAVEAIESTLDQLNALGTEVQQFHKRHGEPLTVIGYFNELPDDKAFDNAVSNELRICDLSRDSIRSVERKTIEKRDWLAEWKKHWRPTSVGRFIIVPEWEDLTGVENEKIVVRIDPNMAFGTGTHETTQLCLQAIGKALRSSDSFLDVGTGTGILAIAAARLFNGKEKRILAIDNDPVAVEIAGQNAVRNGVADLIEFRCEEMSDLTPQFDFVCANLTLDTVRPILPILVEKTKRTLLLSGILSEQESALIDSMTSLGIRELKVERAGEWISAMVEF